MSSKLPSAKQFKRYVTSEILPQIRKTGAYLTPEALHNVINNPNILLDLVTRYKEEYDKNLDLQSRVSRLSVEKQIMQPKAEYFDQLVDRNASTGIRETAKEFKVGERKLTSYLLQKKYVYRDKKGKLIPYAKYIDDGLFELKETYNEKTNWTGTQMLITVKGKEIFRQIEL